MTSALATDVGRVRSHNEDSVAEVFLTAGEQTYPGVVLADGMGGHNGGEVASAIAVECVSHRLAQGVEDLSGMGSGWQISLATFLDGAIAEANETILTRADHDPELEGMGTTLVILLLLGRWYVVAYVGDSRAYRYRDDALRQLTVDHNWAEEQIRLGMLTEEQVIHTPPHEFLVRAVGVREPVEPTIGFGSCQAGDLFLVCSDGLTRYIDGAELIAFLQSEPDLSAVTRSLIDEANAHGGADNITVALTRLDALPEGALPEPDTRDIAEDSFERALGRPSLDFRIEPRSQ